MKSAGALIKLKTREFSRRDDVNNSRDNANDFTVLFLRYDLNK